MDLVAARWRFDLPLSAFLPSLHGDFNANGRGAYPKVDFQVSTSAKLSVADLECDRHPVVLVQLLVEALALVRLHLDVVR